MTIPKKYQVFAQPVILIDKDAARLAPNLTSWPKLNAMLRVQAFNEPDLRRLVILELVGGRRWRIVNRLLMRLGRFDRAQLEKKVRGLCRK
jgi:hypothetical protein